jgi:hypothetical protein
MLDLIPTHYLDWWSNSIFRVRDVMVMMVGPKSHSSAMHLMVAVLEATTTIENGTMVMVLVR